MKYALVKTEIPISLCINANIDSVVTLFDAKIAAEKEAMKMYGCTINDYAINGDLCASSFECVDSTTSVVAKVFGNTDVVVIVVKSIDKKEEVRDAD
jgi:hypothetical protein